MKNLSETPQIIFTVRSPTSAEVFSELQKSATASGISSDIKQELDIRGSVDLVNLAFMGLPYILYIVNYPISPEICAWIKDALPLMYRMLYKENMMRRSAFSLETETDRVTFSTECSTEEFNEKILAFLDKHMTRL